MDEKSDEKLRAECGRSWHDIQWDESKIKRFWDFTSQCEGVQPDYFSLQVGDGVVRFLRYLVPMEGRVLDYGCGPGYLVRHLLDGGIACEGLDFSAQGVNAVNARHGTHPLWRGAAVADGSRLPYADGSFDIIICLETIEHIMPGHFAVILGELKRILKPVTGRILFTTPNGEDLARSSVCCPECGCVFHKVQHLSSFSESSLCGLMVRHGFQTVCCGVTNFSRFQNASLLGIRDWSWNYVIRRTQNKWATLKDRLGATPAPIGGHRFHRMVGGGPHLFWFGNRGAH